MSDFAGLTNETIEKMINLMYNGNLSTIPEDLYFATMDRLSEAVFEGFGSPVGSQWRARKLTRLIDNVSVFSASKSVAQVSEMSKYLFDEKGVKTTFEFFKEKAEGVFDQFNNNWLRTEYNTAISMSESASKWGDIKDDAEFLPLLKYVTIGDERVRSSHKPLDGIVKPVGDDFWKTFYPPNDWNCRCEVIQLEDGEEEVTEITKDSNVVIPPKLFSGNAGVNGLVFKGGHPYFTKVADRYDLEGKISKIKPSPAVKQKVIEKTETPSKKFKFKTKKEARETTKELFETKSHLKIKRVTFPTKFTKEDIDLRVNKLSELLSEYRVSKSSGSISEGVTVAFKSTRTAYGSVSRSYYLRGDRMDHLNLNTINFGDKTDSLFSRTYSEKNFMDGGQKKRFKSAIDPENAEVSTVVHEFAHVISSSKNARSTSRFTEAVKNDNVFWDRLHVLNKEYNDERLKNSSNRKLTVSDRNLLNYKIHLGEYAGANIDEFLAEGFTEYKLKKNPSKYAKKIGELVDQFYKK